MMTIRMEREQKVERCQKESGKKGGKKLGRPCVGESFAPSTFFDFGAAPSRFWDPTPRPTRGRWALKSRRY